VFCKQCGYRLWNLPSRTCPECGAPFRISDFDFTLNSVEFRCPHCGQGYYGTGERGHLIPPEFDCARCRNHIHMDQMVLLPTSGVDEERTRVDEVPWFDSRKRGILSRWFGTVRMALFQPARLIDGTPATGKTASAFGFALLTNVAVYLAFAVPLMAFSFLMVSGVAAGGGRAGTIVAMIGSTAVMAGIGLGFVLALILVGGAITHGILRMTGPTHAGLSRTYQAMSLSSGANIVSAIPCLGGYFGWIWWLISAVLMVRSGQKVSGGRAALAVLTVPLLSIGIVLGLAVWSVSVAMTQVAAGGFTATIARDEARAVYDALKAYANEHNGIGPAHGVELLAGDYALLSAELVQNADTLAAHPIGDTSLAGFDDLPPLQKDRAVAGAIAGLPQNVIAHRVGDCVFTYHGINFNTADQRLWAMVWCPGPPPSTQPATFTATQPAYPTHVAVRLDGTTDWINPYSTHQLALQNRIRAENGLAPLPDPTTVTEAAPATATIAPPLVPRPGEDPADAPPDEP
jgi:predicted Zn finger-like uncharacterized protein